MRARSWLKALGSLAFTAPVGSAFALGFSVGDTAPRECYMAAAFGAGTRDTPRAAASVVTYFA